MDHDWQPVDGALPLMRCAVCGVRSDASYPHACGAPATASRLCDILPPPDVCERCGVDSMIVDTRPGRGYRRRRHRCPACGRRWNSYETRIHPARLLLKAR